MATDNDAGLLIRHLQTERDEARSGAVSRIERMMLRASRALACRVEHSTTLIEERNIPDLGVSLSWSAGYSGASATCTGVVNLTPDELSKVAAQAAIFTDEIEEKVRADCAVVERDLRAEISAFGRIMPDVTDDDLVQVTSGLVTEAQIEHDVP